MEKVFLTAYQRNQEGHLVCITEPKELDTFVEARNAALTLIPQCAGVVVWSEVIIKSVLKTNVLFSAGETGDIPVIFGGAMPIGR